MVKMKTILLMLAGFASTVLMMPQISAYAQSPSYKHIFKIYASGPESNVKAVEVATAKIAELEQCGIASISDHTYRYQGLADKLFVTLSGPHIDMAAAKAELQRAKLCGIEGYTKRATYLGGE